TNLATHPLENVIDRIRVAETVGLFTSEQEGPAEIARTLLARGLDYFRIYVCENIGGPGGRVTQGGTGRSAAWRLHTLHVVILVAQAGPARSPGDAAALPPVRQPRRLLRAEPAQERADHTERGARPGAGADGHSRRRRGVGHRRRVGFGGDRGGANERARPG